MTETMLVRVRSHRASASLRRLLDVENLQYWWSWQDGNNIAEIPVKHREAALAIKGVSGARPKGKLMKCWAW